MAVAIKTEQRTVTLRTALMTGRECKRGMMMVRKVKVACRTMSVAAQKRKVHRPLTRSLAAPRKLRHGNPG